MVNILNNNVLKNSLSVLRDKNTSPSLFREYIRLAGYLSTYEILGKELNLEKKPIETPITETEGFFFNQRILQIVIMRAGLPFAEGGGVLLDQLEIKRDIGVVDAQRIEENVNGLDFEIEISSFKVPNPKDSYTIIYDPMLATGATMIEVLRRIESKEKPLRIIVNSIISASFGVDNINKFFPEVSIYTLSLDRGGTYKGLNKRGYIVPGLGDCGDRAFGTY